MRQTSDDAINKRFFNQAKHTGGFMFRVFLSSIFIAVSVSSMHAQWVEQNSSLPDSLTVNSMDAVNQNVVWALGADFALNPHQDFTRTTNGGSTWTAGIVAGASGLVGSCISAIDANTAWAAMGDLSFATSGGIFKTTNGGANWGRQATAYPAPGGFVDIVHMFDANTGLAIGDPNGGYYEIYTTSNGGTNWIRVPSANIPPPLNGEFALIIGPVFSVFGNTSWYGTSQGRIYRSTNRGSNWTVASLGLDTTHFVDAIAFRDSSNGLTTTFSAIGGSRLLRTSDGGITWSPLSMPSRPAIYFLNAVPNTQYYVLSSDVSLGGRRKGSAYSSNDGTSWTLVDTLEHGVGAFIAPNVGWSGMRRFASIQGGMWGWSGNVLGPPQVWTRQAISLIARVSSIRAINENVVWAGADSGRYLRTTNGGITWLTDYISNAGAIVMNSIAPINKDTAYFEGTNYGGGDGRIYKTTNGGTTWVLQYQNTAPEAFFNSIAFWDKDNGIAMSDPVNGSFLIVTTTNGGATWNQTPAGNIPAPLSNEYGGFGDAGGTVLSVQGTSNAWFGTAYGPGTSRICRAFRSTNKGQNWTVANVPFVDAGNYFGATSIVFRDALNGFVGGQSTSGSGLAKTTDGGLNWSLVPSFVWSALGTLALVPGNNNNSIIATADSVALSRNGGATWNMLSPDGFTAISFASPTVGWASSPVSAGGLFKYAGSPLTTVEEPMKETLPLGFSLHQNYPNPFNPATEIEFSVAENGRATLDVFNILGQKIATLFDDVAEAGQVYHVRFDGNKLASGVYLYRLESGRQSEVRRLVMLR